MCAHRHNQALEQDSEAMQEEKNRLQAQSFTLTQRMEALLHDKFEHSTSSFDAETPIEKILNLMQAFITQVGLEGTLHLIMTCAQCTIKFISHTQHLHNAGLLYLRSSGYLRMDHRRHMGNHKQQYTP